MKEESIYSYVMLGTTIRYLQDADESFIVFDKGGILENLDSFFKNLLKLKMHVTYRFSKELMNFKEKLEAESKGLTITDRKLIPEEIKQLIELMGKIREVFIAEVQGVYAYITSEKRFELKKLLNSTLVS